MATCLEFRRVLFLSLARRSGQPPFWHWPISPSRERNCWRHSAVIVEGMTTLLPAVRRPDLRPLRAVSPPEPALAAGPCFVGVGGVGLAIREWMPSRSPAVAAHYSLQSVLKHWWTAPKPSRAVELRSSSPR